MWVALQIEGAVSEAGRSPSIWDKWAATPGHIYHNETRAALQGPATCYCPQVSEGAMRWHVWQSLSRAPGAVSELQQAHSEHAALTVVVWTRQQM